MRNKKFKPNLTLTRYNLEQKVGREDIMKINFM